MKVKLLSISKKSTIFKIIIIMIIMSFLLISCKKSVEKSDTKKPDKNAVEDINAIQVWYYVYMNDNFYKEMVNNIATKIRAFCKVKGIPVKIVRYDESKLSYDDYILKRNTAMATGNVIVIDDARKLADISKQHYDYTKIESYNNLFDMYKNRYCIPLGVGYVTRSISNELFKYYKLEPSKDVITYSEYLKLKREAMDMGAKFVFNENEWTELVDQNLMKNDLYMLGDKSEIIKDEKKFKEAAKKTIIEIYEDYEKYYGLYSDIRILEKGNASNVMHDMNSKININMENESLGFLTEYWNYWDDNKIFVLLPNKTQLSPCIYINKNITDERIHDIVNDAMRVTYYKVLVFRYSDGFVDPAPWYSPTSDTADMRKYAEMTSDWTYEGRLTPLAARGWKDYEIMIDTINQAYELLLKNGEESIKNVDYYFSNEDYNNLISSSIQKLVKKLITDKLDYNNEDVDKMLDKKVNEFIMNFYVHFD